MKSILKFGASLSACVFVLSAAAQAASILTIVGNATNLANEALPGNYDPVPVIAGTAPGTIVQNSFAPGSGLWLDAGATVKATFLGKEAGFTNSITFTLGDPTTFTNLSAAGTAITKIIAGVPLGGEFLSFKFSALSDIVNGAVPSATANLGTIAFKVISANFANATVLAFLNDFGGGDADWDDMVIEFKATRAGFAEGDVPLPAALPLLAGALGGLGALGRWRKRQQKTKAITA